MHANVSECLMKVLTVFECFKVAKIRSVPQQQKSSSSVQSSSLHLDLRVLIWDQLNTA